MLKYNQYSICKWIKSPNRLNWDEVRPALSQLCEELKKRLTFPKLNVTKDSNLF